MDVGNLVRSEVCLKQRRFGIVETILLHINEGEAVVRVTGFGVLLDRLDKQRFGFIEALLRGVYLREVQSDVHRIGKRTCALK